MVKVGIVFYGIHIPWYRLNRKVLRTALGAYAGGSMPGDKAVANFDEDSLTMGTSAAQDCLKGINLNKVTGFIFASTTHPYLERATSGIVATALDLKPQVRTADFGDSIKCGTSAILFAADYVNAGNPGNILVCASECRIGQPGSNEEVAFGDGAAALLLGSENAVAILEDSYSTTYDFPDYRRLDGKKFVQSTEDRFIREEGYQKILPEVIKGLLNKSKLEAKDITKIAYPCNNIKVHEAIAKKAGFAPEQVQAPLVTLIGEPGSASPLISLIAMLEEAKAGDTLMVIGYGNGASALLFKVTAEIDKIQDRTKFKRAIESGFAMSSYSKYLAFRSIMPYSSLEHEIGRTLLPELWRERQTVLSLYGTKCKVCGTPQLPRQHVCVNPECKAIDQMEPYNFSNVPCKVFTFTEDYAAISTNPPLTYGFIDFEGGGRTIFDISDVEAGMLKTGMAMKMSLRQKFPDPNRGFSGYYWKAVPVR